MKAIKKRKQPELVVIGNHQMLDSRRWNVAAMAKYIVENAKHQWMPVSVLARTAYGHNDKSMRAKVRRYLHREWHAIINLYGEFMLTKYDESSRAAIAVKLYDPGVDLEEEMVVSKLDRMRKRREMTSEQYEDALTLLAAKRKTPIGEA